MGWAYGVLADGREVGYSVLSICEEPDCGDEISRGLSQLCGSMHGQDDGEGCGPAAQRGGKVSVQANYRPGNGTEGDYFNQQCCDRCVRDHEWHTVEQGESCPIILDALSGDHSYPNPEGPPQWSHDPTTGESWCSEFTGPCGCGGEGDDAA